MRFTVAAVVAVALTGTNVRAGADDDAFKKWAQGLSDAQHLPICAWGTLAHAESRSPGRFVWLNDPGRPYAHWLVFESAGRRWWTRHDERAPFGGEELSCNRSVPLTWMNLQALKLHFLDQSNVPDIEQVVTLLDGDVVLLSDDRVGYHDAFSTNWVRARQTYHEPNPRDGEGSDPDEQAIFFALPEGSRWWPRLPPLHTEVTFGQKRWTGKDDADLSVRVVVVPAGLRVELDARDDQRLPPAAGADARAMVRADQSSSGSAPSNIRSNAGRSPPSSAWRGQRTAAPSPAGCAPTPAISRFQTSPSITSISSWSCPDP